MGNWPSGFGFRPTDEEAVSYYVVNKNRGNDQAVAFIAEVDVYKLDPTELPGLSVLQTNDPEWYFFCRVPGNYPNGQQMSRSTRSGHWKSTGNDREIKSGNVLIGMKKTLVFYRGRGNTAERTDWVIHEYRAAATDPATVQSHYVLCRVFDKQHKPANSEPVSELTQESRTPFLDNANMPPHVEGQSRGSTPVPVSEINQTANSPDLEQPPQDWSFLGPMYSPMPTPYHYDWSQMSHMVGEFQEAGNSSFNIDELCNQRDSTIIMENGSGEGSHAPPHLEAEQASSTLSSASTAGQFHDGHDGLHNDTGAQTDPQTDQGFVKQGEARRRIRLQIRSRVRPVTMESRDESSMPEDRESKSIDKEGPKAEEKEIAVSELKQNSPLEPSSFSEELITNDRADRNSTTIILIEGETTKASGDRFSFWSFADILRVAAVVVILLILVISIFRSFCL